MFHRNHGSLVTLSNGNRTAQRSHPAQEFNNGVILSAEPLQPNQLFEVKIDRKISSWSGSIEIGVTTCEPDNLQFPASATGFREGTWIMSGNTVLMDGHTVLEEYGRDLDTLGEGDTVGVLRQQNGVLHFYVNGVDQGPSVANVPSTIYAVVDMYGKCCQVSIVSGNGADNNADATYTGVTVLQNDLTNEAIVEAHAAGRDTSVLSDGLAFHERTGSLVKLSNHRRTAERRRPCDEFNNGVVMTNRPVRDDELFEIRLDRLVDKWSGSIEVGITTHDPNNLDFPATMTNMRTSQAGGTIMMSGCGILTNGKGTRREYGEFNLDELTTGDRIGLIRKSSGALHYYINGQDQGVAATRTPTMVWGVVDLYGMAVKVTIIDPHDPDYHDHNRLAVTTSPDPLRMYDGLNFGAMATQYEMDQNPALVSSGPERLLFHRRCGKHAEVINGGRSVHRPNAADDFNHGVVLTNRQLRAGEIFEVQLDKIIDKWAGSIEIGVTTYSADELDFPSTMTNLRSGTWMMTGNGVMHNGTTILDEYGRNLDQLRTGDRVGVVVRSDGSLHFYVNGTDQGEAVSGLPPADTLYGVIDLYGIAAKATVLDTIDQLVLSREALEAESGHLLPSSSTNVPIDAVFPHAPDELDLHFHALHGRNATINGPHGRTASRPNARGEFNDAIVMSHRPLRDNELFEVSIDRLVDRWSGSLEAGVSLIQPEQLDFPNTMTDIDYDTWMLSGSSIMQDGSTVRNGYRLDLDGLAPGDRIGMMRSGAGALHYFYNGVDQGVACTGIAQGVYAVIDLYGQCAQVTITSGSGVRRRRPPLAQDNTRSLSVDIDPALTSPISAVKIKFVELSHRFSQCAGRHIALKNNGATALRVHQLKQFNEGVVFSADPLRSDETFEVKIEQVTSQWSGSLQIGLTSMAISDTTPINMVPSEATQLTAKVTWVVTGSEVKKNGVTIKENYAPSLDRLQVGDRVGIRRTADGHMVLSINGQSLGVAATNIPRNVFALVDLYGPVEQVSITSSAVATGTTAPSPALTYSSGLGALTTSTTTRPPSIPSSSCSESGDDLGADAITRLQVTEEDQDLDTSATAATPEAAVCVELASSNHGKNVAVSHRGLTAARSSSYNHAVVVGNRPLPRNHTFTVRIDKLDDKWTSSLSIGVLGFCPGDKFSLPATATAIRRPAWVIQGDSLFHCGDKVRSGLAAPDLDVLGAGHTVGVLLDGDGSLHLVTDGVDHGVLVAARLLDAPSGGFYPVVDLYGQCTQITVVTETSPDYTEKANMEEGMKENTLKMPRSMEPAAPAAKSCEYQNMCQRFRLTLGLPEGYFQPVYNRCYCDTCHKLRGDEPYYEKGDPPRHYALPFGWVKFGLRLPAKAETLSVFEKWHMAYHGTSAAVIRRILDTADLFGPVDMLPLCAPVSSEHAEKNQPEQDSASAGARRSQITLSPTVRYVAGGAGSQHTAPTIEYRDPKSKKVYQARLAFQVCVKPGSYKICGQSMTGANEPIDPKFSNTEVEWVTKEKGATVLCALLCKLEP